MLNKTRTQIISSLILLASGCGKKIAETSSASKQVPGVDEFKTELSIEIDTSLGNVKKYKLYQDARVKVPAEISWRKGLIKDQIVNLYFNYVSDLWYFDYDLKCIYKPTSFSFVLEKCQNNRAQDLGDISRQKFPLDEGKWIKLEVEDNNSNFLTLETIIPVTWLTQI